MQTIENTTKDNQKDSGKVEYEFLQLNPVVDEEYAFNAKLLHDKVKDEKIKNIGIIGSYGSGKSSLIETFCSEYKNKDKIKVLKVSLASFNGDDNNENKDQARDKSTNTTSVIGQKNCGIGDIDNAVERSILQQMLYVEPGKKLPFSKIARTESIPFGKYVFLCIATIALIALVGLLYDIFASFPQREANLLEYFLDVKIWQTMVSIVIVLFFVCCMVRTIKIARIKLNPVEIELNNTQGSLLNSFLDEILYFFSKTKYNTVFFEDLDRLNDLSIFVKLRELNTILNSNKKIAKQGKITFIYAVKTDIFSEHTERTKFFDFILNVYPTLSPENACAIINDGLEKSGLGEGWLSVNYVYDISSFVMDRRVLNSTINDCLQYIGNSTERTTCDEPKKRQLLFSVMLYKNVCPNKYADLEHHRGELIELLSRAEKVRRDKINTLKEKLNDCQIKLEEVNAACDINIMRYLIKGLLVSNVSQGYSYYSKGVNVEEIADFTNKQQEVYCINPYNSRYYCNATIDTLNGKLGKTLDSIFKDPRKIEQYTKECNEISKEISEIPQNNYEFAIKYPNETFDENVTPLLRALIVNKYITENYVDYISLGNEESMTVNDNEFCQRVISKSNPKYEAVVDSEYVVVERLTDDKFLLPSILNVRICNYLFENKERKYDIKRENLKRLLTSNSVEVKEFLNSYFSRKDYYKISFVNILVENEVNFVMPLTSGAMENQEKAEIIKDLLLRTNADKLAKQESISLIKDLLAEDDDFNKNINIYHSGFKVLQEIGYKIEDISRYNLNSSKLGVVAQNNFWKLDYNNLTCMLSRLNNTSVEEINKKGIGLINQLDENIRAYILNDKAFYVHNIMLRPNFLELDENDFRNLLLDTNISEQDKFDIIAKQKEPMSYEKDVSIDVQISLLNSNKVKATCKDLNELLTVNSEKGDLKSAIAKYMYAHYVDMSDFTANAYPNLAYCIVNDTSFENDVLAEKYSDKFTGFSWDVSKISNEASIIFLLNNDMIAINAKNANAVTSSFKKATKVLAERYIEQLISKNLLTPKLAQAYIESPKVEVDVVAKLCKLDNVDFIETQPVASKLVEMIIDNKIETSDNVYNKISNLMNKVYSNKIKSRELFVSQCEYIENDKEEIKERLLMLEDDVFVDLVNNGVVKIPNTNTWKTDIVVIALKNIGAISVTTRKNITIKWND